MTSYTIPQAAYLLYTSNVTLYKWISTYSIPVHVARGTWRRIAHDDLRAFAVTHMISLDRIDKLNPFTRSPESIDLQDMVDLCLMVGETESTQELLELLEKQATLKESLLPLFHHVESCMYDGVKFPTVKKFLREYLMDLYKGARVVTSRVRFSK